MDELKDALARRFKELEEEGEFDAARGAVKTIKSLEQAKRGETLSDDEEIRKRLEELRAG